MSNVETCIFDELAQLLNDELGANYLGGRGVAKVVKEAYTCVA